MKMDNGVVDRRNYLVPPAFELLWGIGVGVSYFQTVLPAFLNEVNASRIVIGFTQAMPFIAAMVVQPVIGLLSPRIVKRKRLACYLEGGGSLAIAIMGVAVLSVPHSAFATWGAALFVALYVPFFVMVNAGSTFYSGLLVDLIPRMKRGTVSGWQVVSLGIGTILSTRLIYPVLADCGLETPRNYGLLFAVGGVMCMVASLVFLLFSEGDVPLVAVDGGIRHLGRNWLREFGVLWRTRVFRRWLVAAVCGSLCFSSVGFLTLFYVSAADAQGGVTAELVGTLSFVFYLAMMAGGLTNGRIADVLGYKVVAMIVSGCYAVCFFLPVVGRGAIPAVIPFALAGYANSGIAMWRVLFLRELCPDQNSTNLVAVSWFAPAPFVIAGTLGFGKILDMTDNSYGPVFVVLIVLALVSLLCCMLGIPEPRRAERG